MPPAPTFLCDGMLGHVTRWLRLLGFDVLYAGSRLSDDEILERAAAEGRVLATRDVELWQRAAKRGIPAVRLSGGPLERELEEALRGARAALDPGAFFTRCTNCNGGLTPADEGTVAARVPPKVRAERTEFSVCRSCGQVYWEGSHVAEIERTVERLRARLAA